MPCMCTYDHRFLLIDDSTARFAIVHHNLDRYRDYVLHEATEESEAMATNLRKDEGKKLKKETREKKDTVKSVPLAERTQSQDSISSFLQQAAEAGPFEEVPLDDEPDILPDEDEDWELLYNEIDMISDEDEDWERLIDEFEMLSADDEDWELLEGADVEDDYEIIDLQGASGRSGAQMQRPLLFLR